MNKFTNIQTNENSIIDSHFVLKNTYFLLSLTLSFSVLTSIISIFFNLPTPGFVLTFIFFYGLLFLINKYSNNELGIIAVFLFTGFIGYSSSSFISLFLSNELKYVLILSLISTAIIFFSCSIYVFTTKRSISFLHGILMSCFISILIMSIARFFLNIPAISIVISIMSIIFSTGAIMLETNDILNGGEKNYILATVNIYVSLYNIFINILSLSTIFRNSNEE
ncbi:MAG: Bax inhibitor-1 family protein [Enterobacteriaceae bacterium]